MTDDDKRDPSMATDRDPPRNLAVPEIPITAETRITPGLEPGTVLAGKFKVERVINSGGMGIILVAHHVQLDQRVAIKVLRAHVLDDPEMVARFAREARVAARIKSEHVVRIIDVGSLPTGLPYMVMEHLQGSDLSVLAKARGPLPHEEVVEYVLQACEPLAEAHIAGVVHRDLKPANLFLTRRADGTPLLKVLDFGISKVLEPMAGENMTKTSMLMGSPQYMSPEQLRSARKVDGRADIWALGIVLYRLISGRHPFQAESTPELCVEILHGEPAPLTNAPEGLCAVVTRCLSKSPEERFQNVAELAVALRPFGPERAHTTIARIAALYASVAQRKTSPTVRDIVRPSMTPKETAIELPIVVVDAVEGASAEPATVTGSVSTSASVSASTRTRFPMWLAAFAMVFAVGSAAVTIYSTRSHDNPAPTPTPNVETPAASSLAPAIDSSPAPPSSSRVVMSASAAPPPSTSSQPTASVRAPVTKPGPHPSASGVASTGATPSGSSSNGIESKFGVTAF